VARARAQAQPLPATDDSQGLNSRITAYLKNPLLFPPELGAWVRSQVVRNPTVKIETYQLPSLDKKHYVGATNEPAFQNGWGNYGGGFDTCFFYKDNQGRCYLQGMISGGTIGATIFSLPSAYRPLGGQVRFAIVSNNVFGYLDVLAAGQVVAVLGNNAYVSLNGLSFRIA